MTRESCRCVWTAPPDNSRAERLDVAHPHCACECHSLCEDGHGPVADEDVLARILTSPDGYDIDAREIVTGKLTQVYSCGLSVVRRGASDNEILETIHRLVNGQHEPQELFGAAIFAADQIRGMGDGTRWFGVYATDDEAKKHHGDIAGTTPKAASKKAVKNEKTRRRYQLRDRITPQLITAANDQDLLRQLRESGI